ncbi:MAG: ATP-binding cassette domain-containing protein [Fulvivirga sp.]
MQQIHSVEIKSISHSFDHSILLSDLNFSFEEDKVTAILGKSGSGKSTLLQIINGMVKPREGKILFNGQPIEYKNIHELRLKIGYVVQQIGLFPHMTIRENINLLGKISKKPKDDINQRVLELLDMVNLSASYLGKFPHELSGGEQQRAGLCRAMLLNPSLLLMDEPFASLDYGTKYKIYVHLLDIQKRECRTVLLVTHDWEEAVKLADYFIWIDEGKIRESGDKTNLEKLKSTYFSEL